MKDVGCLRDAVAAFSFRGEVALALSTVASGLYFVISGTTSPPTTHSVPRPIAGNLLHRPTRTRGMRAGFEYFRNVERDAQDFAARWLHILLHAGAGADRGEKAAVTS